MSERSRSELFALQEVLAGRYSIERELGRGGMGIVYLARDVALDRMVAIKLLPPALAADADYRERFLAEARTAAGLSHPNIVPIHSVEEHGTLVFFVMGYVDGETLRERVERVGALSTRYVMKVMQEVAWALGYAHQRGIVHRDIKPDNIMIEEATDRAMVTDFGIAQVGRVEGEDATGEIIGTARYMSPEQACGETVDGRSDLYSLAATMFYALTGRAPFDAPTVPAMLALQVSTPAPLIQSVCPEASDRLAAVIDRCLEKAPANRIQTGDEVAREVGDARGRDLRAPPLVRSFVRNAEVTTMVIFALAIGGQSATAGTEGVSFSLGGPGIIGLILIIQLVMLARRLLREGYAYEDIRAALLAEAAVQEEEANVATKRRWLKRMNTMWHKLWAGKFGRWFFGIAGKGVKPPERPAHPSADATELFLSRAAVHLYRELPAADRSQLGDVPAVVDRLESHAERLRGIEDSAEQLTATVAALEKLRLALLRLQDGEGSVEDLTLHLERAREIGDRIDRELAGRGEVDKALRNGK
jgi:serine/threonine-protein kinase